MSRFTEWSSQRLGWRYAQRNGGRKMHLVGFFGTGEVTAVALCGVTPDKRGHWRMTSNVPWAHACRNCQRIAR